MTNSKVQILTGKFVEYFDGLDAVRDEALRSSREISKKSSSIIRRLHSQKTQDLTDLLNELTDLGKKYKELKQRLKPYPELYFSNFIENNIQEYVEAMIMLTLMKNNLKLSTLPNPDTLAVKYSTYLLGLSDVIGELRRCTLDAIRTGELTQATSYMATMEELFEIIIDLNYTDGVLPLRRKQDVARALIEKTRSELAFAVSEYSLKENISGLQNELNKYYKKVIRK